MSKLCHDHWLAEAKRLPVGRSNRIYHGAERRPNLVIRNLQDSYRAYCHSCHEGQVVKKEFVKPYEPPVLPEKTKDHGVLTPLVQLPEHKLLPIIRFLNSKGLSYEMVERYAMYSAKDERLVFQTPTLTIGRDVTGKSKAKWLRYKGNRGYAAAVFVNKDHPQGNIVLVEDYLSVLKGHHYITKECLFSNAIVSMQGTDIKPELTEILLNADHVTLCFDNDAAGIEGARKAAQQLDLLGISNSTIFPDVNKDPKDMWGEWWIPLLR